MATQIEQERYYSTPLFEDNLAIALGKRLMGVELGVDHPLHQRLMNTLINRFQGSQEIPTFTIEEENILVQALIKKAWVTPYCGGEEWDKAESIHILVQAGIMSYQPETPVINTELVVVREVAESGLPTVEWLAA